MGELRVQLVDDEGVHVSEVPVRAHDHELAIRRQHGDEVLEPSLLLLTDARAFSIGNVAEVIDDDEVVVRGDEVAERADGPDGRLAEGLRPRI